MRFAAFLCLGMLLACAAIGCIESWTFRLALSSAAAGWTLRSLVGALGDYRASSSLDVVDLTKLPRAVAVPTGYRKSHWSSKTQR